MKQILKYYVRVMILLFPLLFFPLMLDSYGSGKLWFLVMSGFVGLVLWMVNMLIEKKGIVKYNKYLLLGLVFTVWSFISWFRLSLGARMVSFVSPFGFGMILAFFVWFFLWLQVTDKSEFKKQANFLMISGLILLVLSIVTFVLPNIKLPFLTISQGWSLTGSLFGEMALFLILAIEYINRLLIKLKKKEAYQKQKCIFHQ